jgi:hypothetical protein
LKCEVGGGRGEIRWSHARNKANLRGAGIRQKASESSARGERPCGTKPIGGSQAAGACIGERAEQTQFRAGRGEDNCWNGLRLGGTGECGGTKPICGGGLWEQFCGRQAREPARIPLRGRGYCGAAFDGGGLLWGKMWAVCHRLPGADHYGIERSWSVVEQHRRRRCDRVQGDSVLFEPVACRWKERRAERVGRLARTLCRPRFGGCCGFDGRVRHGLAGRPLLRTQRSP